MTKNSTYYADSVLSPEIHAELTRRIQGERVDLDAFTIVIGHDVESGFEARLTLAGTAAWAEVFDGGAL